MLALFLKCIVSLSSQDSAAAMMRSPKNLCSHLSLLNSITHPHKVQSHTHTHTQTHTHTHTYARESSPRRLLSETSVCPSVDDGSDWSTLTAESGEDTPPWPVAMETDECEVVRCVCEVDEENDFMIQVIH